MLVPHHWNPPPPPILGKGYIPYLGYWLPLAITKNTPFWGFSWKIFPGTTAKLPPFSKKMLRCRGIVVWPLDSHAEGPGSNPTVARYFCPSARHFIHIAALDPGVKWGPGRMRTALWLSWHVRACKTATGRNAPQGVEKVHSECRIVSESYDRGNNTLWSALIIIWKSAI